jgi:hypothetical protein
MLTEADRAVLAEMATRADDPEVVEALTTAGGDRSERVRRIVEGVTARTGIR